MPGKKVELKALAIQAKDHYEEHALSIAAYQGTSCGVFFFRKEI